MATQTLNTAAAGQPAQPPQRVIKAEHLQLSLYARKVRPGTRWAAMSNGAHTSSGNRRPAGTGYVMPRLPLLSPMDRGLLWHCIDRARVQGRRELHATFGCGIRALQSEIVSSVMHTGAAS